MNIVEWCKYSIEELQKYKTPKEELLIIRIQERLNSSYDSYEKELQNSIAYLTRRNELNILKKLNRMNKLK